jgi:hypothetical protein
MCLRRAPEKYIAGATLDRADIDYERVSTFLGPCVYLYIFFLISGFIGQ